MFDEVEIRAGTNTRMAGRALPNRLALKAETPPVLIHNTGEVHWDRFQSWPPMRIALISHGHCSLIANAYR